MPVSGRELSKNSGCNVAVIESDRHLSLIISGMISPCTIPPANCDAARYYDALRLALRTDRKTWPVYRETKKVMEVKTKKPISEKSENYRLIR